MSGDEMDCTLTFRSESGANILIKCQYTTSNVPLPNVNSGANITIGRTKLLNYDFADLLPFFSLNKALYLLDQRWQVRGISWYIYNIGRRLSHGIANDHCRSHKGYHCPNAHGHHQPKLPSHNKFVVHIESLKTVT